MPSGNPSTTCIQLLPRKVLEKINRKMSSWLQIHIHLSPNLIYSGYKCMLLIWKCGALDQTLFHSLWRPTKSYLWLPGVDLLEAGWSTAPHTPCTLCLIWAPVGTGGLLEEDYALWPFCSPRLPKKDLHSALPVGSGCGDRAFAEIQPEERHWAGVSSKESVMWPCCAKGEVEWGCLSTALTRAFQAVSRLMVTTSSAIIFGFLEVRKICLPCPPRLLLLV